MPAPSGEVNRAVADQHGLRFVEQGQKQQFVGLVMDDVPGIADRAPMV